MQVCGYAGTEDQRPTAQGLRCRKPHHEGGGGRLGGVPALAAGEDDCSVRLEGGVDMGRPMRQYRSGVSSTARMPASDITATAAAARAQLQAHCRRCLTPPAAARGRSGRACAAQLVAQLLLGAWKGWAADRRRG